MSFPQPAGALARSLDPLPDESLPGFLLRLSHRLEITPRRVADLTGLADSKTNPSNRVKARHLMFMDPTTTSRFAAATALTIDEATGLTLAELRHRYPPLRDAAAPTAKGPRWGPSAWASLTATRYCPQCLAGDGSSIQNLHGGAWARSWRLAVTFACLQHRRLLATDCPGCGQPAAGRGGGALVRQETARLHPAQCRQAKLTAAHQKPELCGFRLDRSPSGSAESIADPRVLALQQRLWHKLDPAATSTTAVLGSPTPVTRYFADLRLVTLLIQMGWSSFKDIAACLAPIDALDASIARRAAHTAQASRQITERPPVEPGAAATAFLIADHILASDPDSARALLRPLVGAAVDTMAWYWWRIKWSTTESECSPALTELVTTEAALLKRPSRRGDTGRRTDRKTNSSAVGIHLRIGSGRCYEARHVPQQLPDHWTDRHLSFLAVADISPLHVKRTIATWLLQRTHLPMSSAEAWEYLDLPYQRGSASIQKTARWLAGPDHLDHVQLAIDGLIADLDDDPDPIDYANRRRALVDWTLPDNRWRQIRAEHDIPQLTAGRDRRTVESISRQAASLLVWSQVTSSELYLSPLLTTIGARHGRQHELLLRATASNVKKAATKHDGAYRCLMTALDDYSTELAQTIDATCDFSR